MTLLTYIIENGFQQKMRILSVFVDLIKAFGKIWKEGLLQGREFEAKEENLRQDVLMHLELPVPEISTSLKIKEFHRV